MLTIRSPDSRPPISASGSVSGETLHISTGTAPGDLNLKLRFGDEAAFTEKASDLHKQAVQLASAQDEQHRIDEVVRSASDFLAAAEAFTVKQDRYASEAASFALGYAEISRRYESYTQAMRKGLNQERSIVGTGQAYLDRGQISISIRQAATEAKLLHNQVVTRHNDDGTKLNELASETATTRQRCGPPNDAVETCINLAASTNRLSVRARALQDAFEASQQTWREQSAAQ